MRPDFTQQTVSLYAVPFPRRTKFTFAPQLSKPSPQIPYEAISIFDPPPTIERVRFEYTASLREKNEAQLLRESCHSFNQPVNVKKSYRSGFTLAVNRKRNLERKSIWIRVFARRFFFFHMQDRTREIERVPSVMFYHCPWFVSSRCKTGLGAIGAIKATREFE